MSHLKAVVSFVHERHEKIRKQNGYSVSFLSSVDEIKTLPVSSVARDWPV
jgi:hypothetical protein